MALIVSFCLSFSSVYLAVLIYISFGASIFGTLILCSDWLPSLTCFGISDARGSTGLFIFSFYASDIPSSKVPKSISSSIFLASFFFFPFPILFVAMSSTSSALFCMFVLVSFCNPFFYDSVGCYVVTDWVSGSLIGFAGAELFWKSPSISSVRIALYFCTMADL
jgi:hypothetical protein